MIAPRSGRVAAVAAHAAPSARRVLPQPARSRRSTPAASPSQAAEPRPAADARQRRVAAGPLPRTPRPRATRSPCSARAPPSGSASTASIPADAVWLGGPLVHRRRDPAPAAAGARDRPRRARSASRPRSATSASTATHRRLRARATPSAVDRGRTSLLAATADPEHPEEVEVSRPSDALEARAAAEERVHRAVPRPRRRRAARRRRRHRQRHGHLACSSAAPRSACAARSARGGAHPRPVPLRVAPALAARRRGGRAARRAGDGDLRLGAGLGDRHPGARLGRRLGAALAIGAIAGLLPALRAARLSPTEALRTA